MIDWKSASLMTTLLMAAPSAAFAGPTAVPVPEPSSLAILAAGMVGAALVKFRKRK
jgi:PEP-CTERM motif-containing protein